MDSRTLKIRAEARKRKKELAAQREAEAKETARKALKLATYFKSIVSRSDYKQLIRLFKEKKAELMSENSKSGLDLIQTEKLRAQISLLDMIMTMPKDFFESEKVIKNIYPELIKE